MTSFNQYSMYSYAAGEFKTICDDKILVDLKKLDSLENYDEILNFVTSNFGEINGSKEIEYPNNIKVNLVKKADLLVVAATQNNVQIFGTCWEPPKEE